MTVNIDTSTRRSSLLTIFFALMAISMGGVLGLSISRISGMVIWVGILGGLIIAIGTLISLEFGLVALIFMTYIRLFNIIEVHSGPSLAFPFMLFLILLIAIRWIFEQRLQHIRLKTLLIFTLYALSTFVSVLFANDFARAQGDLWAFVKGASVAVVVGLLLTRKEAIRSVLWSLISVGIVLGTISVYQYLTSSFDNDFWGFGAAAVQNIVGSTNDYRIVGSLGDPNFYAMVMVVLIPLALERMINEKRFLLKALAGYGLLVILMTIVFTFSRGGFLALCVVAGLSLFWRRPPVVAILVGMLIITLAIPFLPPSYADRIATMTDIFKRSETDIKSEVSFRGRVSEIGVAWLMLRDHPLTGVGAGNYNTEYLSYSRQLGWDPRNEQRGAHNLYLEVAAEQGLLGFTILIYILYSIINGLIQAGKRFTAMHNHIYADMTKALLVGIAGYLTASLFLHNVYPYYFWMLIGISMAVAQIAESNFRDFQIASTSILSDGKTA